MKELGSGGGWNNGNYGSYGNNGSYEAGPLPASHNSHASHASHNSQVSQSPPVSQSSHPILPPRGDYRTLLSYQKSEVIYEITYRFCQRFLSKGDRTIDQMVQAARSGKQNILEGSKAGAASRETEIKLTSVARASLEELLEDYRDFLRVRDLAVWDRQSRQAQYVRRLGTVAPLTFAPFREFVATRPAEVVANIAVCLIHQANYLLDRQLTGLANAFLQNGGLRERMSYARRQARRLQRA
ncbi:MAG: four helix bundle suffix domain-containing protein [Lentisphaeria bacterium]